jgi:outer membrane protein insertion porin family
LQPVPQARVTDAWPIQVLEVTGNQNYSQEQILAVAGLRPGQIATPKDFEAARDRLAATGAFQADRVSLRTCAGSGKAYAVSFHVVEAGPFFPVRFEDLPLTEEEIKAHLRALDPLFGERIPATEDVLARYAAPIEELLEKARAAGRRCAGG